MKWRTKFTKSFPCRLPLMGAPMAGVSGAELAYETCRAGGLGFIAAGHLSSKDELMKLEKEIARFRSLSGGEYPLCIGFIAHSTFGTTTGWDLFENILEYHEPHAVQFFAGSLNSPSVQNNTTAVKIAHSFGCKVIVQVGTVDEAEQMFDLGVDVIIAQGTEAGGHGIRPELGCGTLSLVSMIVEMSSQRKKPIPILAAGGVMDGRDMAAMLTLGADGVVLGTRLWATIEAKGAPKFKNALVSATSSDVVRTRAFDAIANSFSKVKWPVPYDSSSALRNDVTAQWDDVTKLDKALAGSEASEIIERYKAARDSNDHTYMPVYAGKGVGKISSIEPAYDIITRLANEASVVLRSASKILPDMDESR